MRSVQLGYKAFDLHELACHFVAQHAGIYARYGLDVSLLDTRPLADDALPDSMFSAACGAALLRWLRGEQVKVVFVATDKPMFLLCARPGIDRLLDLRGGRIAAYPGAAPPAWFLRIILEDAGLDPDFDVTIDPLRDDASRLELLRAGDADAAVLSSAIMPFRTEELGLRNLFCFGDRIRLPTTGLAVSLSIFKSEPQTVAAMRDSHREAIGLVHADASALREALRGNLFDDERDLDSACELARDFFTPDGLVAAADIGVGIRRLALSMDLPILDERWSLYDCTTRVN